MKALFEEQTMSFNEKVKESFTSKAENNMDYDNRNDRKRLHKLGNCHFTTS